MPKHMRLAPAIILGDTTKSCNPERWLSADEVGLCGCAFGGALLAVGVTYQQFSSEVLQSPGVPIHELPCVKSRWPWLTLKITHEISKLYRQVAAGENNIEDVADYVSTIEPAEETEHTDPGDEQPSDEEIDYQLGSYPDPASDRSFA
jgi:hypothetical protein